MLIFRGVTCFTYDLPQIGLFHGVSLQPACQSTSMTLLRLQEFQHSKGNFGYLWEGIKQQFVPQILPHIALSNHCIIHMQLVNVFIYLGYSYPIFPFETLLANQKVQVLTEVRKQMRFFDAELKDSKRRAEEMQQAPCFFDRHDIVDVLIRANE